MRKLVFCIIPLGLAVVFILLCLQGCPNLYDRTVVAGIITDVDGTPLQGAKIYCHYTRYKGWIGIHPTVSGDLEGYTNEEGRFELDAYRAVTGRLTFSNFGYKSQKLTFTRHKGEPEKAELKVRLNKYGKDNVTIFSDKEISSEPINQGYASLSFQGDFPESTLLFRPNKNENSDSIIFFTFDESKEERICRLKSGSSVSIAKSSMREFNYISEVRTSGYKEELVWEYKKWIQLFLSIKKNGYRIRCELVVDEDDGVRRLIIRYLYITNGDAFLHENMDRYGTISYRDYREMIEGMHDGF